MYAKHMYAYKEKHVYTYTHTCDFINVGNMQKKRLLPQANGEETSKMAVNKIMKVKFQDIFRPMEVTLPLQIIAY